MPLDAAPLNRSPLYARACDALRQAILTGRLKPGERLSEVQVANALGISRTPVRESLRSLAAAGLLRQEEGGLTVARVELDEVDRIYESRIALERLTAAAAARRATPEQCTVMAAAITQSAAAGERNDLPEVLIANVRFHRQVALAAANPATLKLLETVWDQIVLFRASVLSDPEEERQVLQEHRLVLAAIRRHAHRQAADLMERHLRADLVRGRRAQGRAAAQQLPNVP